MALKPSFGLWMLFSLAVHLALFAGTSASLFISGLSTRAPSEPLIQVTLLQPTLESRAHTPSLDKDALSKLVSSSQTSNPLSAHPAERKAGLLQPPAPLYPPASIRRGEKGTVHVELVYKPELGRVITHISKSSGYRRLDGAALDAARTLSQPDLIRHFEREKIRKHHLAFEFQLKSGDAQ